MKNLKMNTDIKEQTYETDTENRMSQKNQEKGI
jgi:hypothetical protein